MTKVTLNDVGSLLDATTAVNTINSNSATVETAFDNTLSRDGTTPNQMGASLDMNSNHILNLPQPVNMSEPMRLLDAALLNGGGSIPAQALPVGGTINQILTKNSSTNYDASWLNPNFTVAAGSIGTTELAAGAVSNIKLNASPAGTFKGNPGSAATTPQDFTIQSLATLASPDPVNDYLPIVDHTTGIIKKASSSAIVASQTAGVASIQSLTGAFTLSGGVTNTGTVITADPTYFNKFVSGLTTSLATTTTMTVSAGACTSDDFTVIMKLASITKNVTTSWAVGTSNGSLDTGTIAPSTWYHVFAIQRTDTGVVDVLTSLSATAPTMPGSYTKKRRIGSIWVNGATQIQPYHQFGNDFVWDTPSQDVNVTAFGTSGVLRTLFVPPGVSVLADINIIGINSSTNYYIYASSPLSTDIPAAIENFHTFATGGWRIGNNTKVWTNTSGQIRTRCSASGFNDILEINTYGWKDLRGE